MSPIPLQKPFLDGGIRSINFFNGRLLSAEDLSQETTAHQEARRHLALAFGNGVAFGLEVAPTARVDTRKDPRVTIAAGLSVNRRGHTLALPTTTDVSLARPQNNSTSTPVSAVFGDCPSSQSGAYVAGAGVYLLTISPASGSEGQAPVSGLGNVIAGCNTRYNIEGVQFRLIPLELDLSVLNDRTHLRNRLAYACFGITDQEAQFFFRDPFNVRVDGYGLLDALRPNRLTDCEVPLALLYWTIDNGIEFVDMWSVRRRLTNPAVDQRWPLLLNDRRLSEAEAMFFQFEDQIDDIRVREAHVMANIAAPQRFAYLPSVGMLPVMAEGSPVGFDTQTFFGAHISRDVAVIDANLLRSLLHEALYHEPIDLSAPEKIQLYVIFENIQAIQAKQTNQLALVFASRTLPYRGVARFGFARWDLSRFAPAVI